MTDEGSDTGSSVVPAAVQQDSAQDGDAAPPATDIPQNAATTNPAPEPSTTSGPSTGGGDDTDESRCPPARAGTGQDVTQDDAVAIAEQALAELGTVPPLREVDLDHDDGRMVWDLEFGADHEVEVDATTGQIVKLERHDD